MDFRTIARSAVAVSLLLSFSTFAETPARYLVATTNPASEGGFRIAVSSSPRPVVPHEPVAFEAFDGFAATLTEADVEALRASSGVRWIERVVERNAFAIESNSGGSQVTPWGIPAMQLVDSRGARPGGVVNVVVIDTGLDLTHDDLLPAYAGGINFIDTTKQPIDDAGHGTHVAGTIAALDNQIGVIGVAPGSRIWAAKVLNAQGRGTTEGVIQALDWSIAQKRAHGGRWVINLSLGSKEPSLLEREAVARVIAEGIIVVAASGNNGLVGEPVSFPAAYAGVVTVGAIGQDSAVAGFSNRGPEVDFVAPGVNVYSTMPKGFVLESVLLRNDQWTASRVIEHSGLGEVTAELVACGVGRPEDFPADVAGKIALIRRGADLTFAVKAANALAAGAVASVIYNNIEEPDEELLWTLGGPTNPAPIAIGISLSAGERLLAQGGIVTVAVRDGRYGFNTGTSMASPHIAGALALLWSLAPDASPNTIVNALVTTAVDMGTPGFDNTSGHGLPNIDAAARQLAPSAFDGRPRTGRRASNRGRR